jgi:hypothetical protein
MCPYIHLECNTKYVRYLTEIKKKKKRKKKKIRNLPLVSDLDAIGGLSTNMRPL